MDKLVIFDWAGTTVDFGCQAPVEAFELLFNELDLKISRTLIQAYMGLNKREHLREILSYHSACNNDSRIRELSLHNFDELYQKLVVYMQQTTSAYKNTRVIPGVLETVKQLDSMGFLIGSTTGYPKSLMERIQIEAKLQGYSPNCIICGDEVTKGRPSPAMIFENMVRLDVFDRKKIVKVGDTLADIREGQKAEVFTIGILLGSSLLGLNAEEIKSSDSAGLAILLNKTRQLYEDAGADAIATSMYDIPSIVKKLVK